MLPAVAIPRLHMKVRTIIKPNKVSEIRSIGSSTRTKGISETADIKSKRPWLNLQGPILLTTLIRRSETLMDHRCGSTVRSVAIRSDSSTLYWIAALRDRWSGSPEDWNSEQKLRIQMRKAQQPFTSGR